MPCRQDVAEVPMSFDVLSMGRGVDGEQLGDELAVCRGDILRPTLAGEGVARDEQENLLRQFFCLRFRLYRLSFRPRCFRGSRGSKKSLHRLVEVW